MIPKRNRKKSWVKGAVQCLIFCLSFSVFGIRASELDNLRIPAKLGTVKDKYDAGDSWENKGQIIIHIQDAHCNYQAQKNMAGILEYLVDNYGLKLIMVEGGSGDVGLSHLRANSSREKRKQVAEKYLRDGKISGEEYLDIVSDYDLELYGVEKEEFYQKNLEALMKIDSYRDTGKEEIRNINKLINDMKPYVYSPKLIKFEDKKASYEKKDLPLTEYCGYLRAAAEDNYISWQDYSSFYAFVNSVYMERRLDFNEVEAERNQFINDLASKLDEEGLAELSEKTRMIKEGIMEPGQYYGFLAEQARGLIDIGEDYPLLLEYMEYLGLTGKIKIKELLDEIGGLEQAIGNALCSTDTQKKVYRLSFYGEILSKFLDMDINPEEYNYFQDNRNDFYVSDWLVFLERLYNEQGLAFPGLQEITIDRELDGLDRFYRIGVKRSEIFVENIEKKLSEEVSEQIAVFIAGGFHTPEVCRLLRERGYSYLVVTPVVNEKTGADKYISILKEKSGSGGADE